MNLLRFTRVFPEYGYETTFVFVLNKIKILLERSLLTLRTISDRLTGNLHFTHVEMADGKEKLPGKCRAYTCAVLNELFGSVSLSTDHCIIPGSGTQQTVTVQTHLMRQCSLFTPSTRCHSYNYR